MPETTPPPFDAAVDLAGLHLKNPILTASGTFGYGLEFATFGDLSSLGGMVVKGVSLERRRGNPLPRIAETPCGMLNAIGLQNSGAKHFLSHSLPKLPWQDTAVVVNLYAQSSEEFAQLTATLAGAPGVAAFEVNISCPNVNCGGMVFGQDPEAAAEVTAAVVQAAAGKPVIVKLSPNVTDIVAIALAAEEAGASAVSCINTLTGMAVNLRTRRPRLGNIIGGLSGPAIKPVALRCVWQVAQAVRIPVIGIGGIATAEDVLEFILVGATAVQVGTANFMRPDTAFRLVKDSEALARDLNLACWADLRGQLKV